MALSRKSFIGEITGKSVEDRLAGTLCANIYSVIKGCDIVRVHDVKETVDSLKILNQLLRRG
jgi:dihydropteroate synthase